jgi:hypothetical protein
MNLSQIFQPLLIFMMRVVPLGKNVKKQISAFQQMSMISLQTMTGYVMSELKKKKYDGYLKTLIQGESKKELEHILITIPFKKTDTGGFSFLLLMRVADLHHLYHIYK